jgi:predicted PurR-regulated permease PerM
MDDTNPLSEEGIGDGVAVGGSGPSQPGSPAGERNAAQVAQILLTIVVMVGVVTYLGPILKPFLVAVFLYFASKSAAGFLIRRGFPTLRAYLTLFAVGTVAVVAIALHVYGQALAFQEQWPRYHQRILSILSGGPREGRTVAELFSVSSREAFNYFFGQGLFLVELLTMAFFYLLFILLSGGRLARRVRRAFPGARGEQILVVADKISDGMEQFMHVKTLVSLGLGASSAAILYLFGLEGWLLWGILFFALNYITYIGSMAACVPPVVFAFLDLDNPAAAVAAAALVVLNRFVWVDYVETRMAGRHLNIDSILLFLWLAYWGWAWGVVGLVLAFPLVTSLKIVLENLEATKSWAVLMSDE